MEHLNAEKYSLAWFKLAECVSRKEKERALGVYRLLYHSLGDDVLATQLYGDLLLCFEDKAGAASKYLQAAELYKNQNKIVESIAVYEHLILLEPESDKHMIQLCELYLEIDMSFKVVGHIENIIQNNNFDLAFKLLEKLDSAIKSGEHIRLQQLLLFALLKHKSAKKEFVTAILEKSLDLLVAAKDNALLQSFLSKLKVESEDCYTYASEYLKNNKK